MSDPVIFLVLLVTDPIHDMQDVANILLENGASRVVLLGKYPCIYKGAMCKYMGIIS